jgi:hypothetical protein
VQRIVLIFLAALLTTAVSPAQRKPTVPMAAVREEPKLKGERRIRYLLRQLDLTAEQREYARTLIATIVDEAENPPLSLEQVYTLMAEQQEAEKEGDEERVERVRQQLRALGRGADREGEFFMNMETELTDGQKETLHEARERLRRNPSGALRPVDVFRVVYAFDLSKEQKAHVDRWNARFRDDLRRIRTLDDDQRFQLMNGLLEALRAELTPEQQSRFDLSIRRLRPDLAGRSLVVRVPQTQPTAEEEDEEPEEED